MPEQTQTPLEQALTARLNAEISTSMNLQVQLIIAQRAIAAAQARIEELEKKAATEAAGGQP